MTNHNQRKLWLVQEAFEAVHENGVAYICWTKHSSGNSAQYSKSETAWTCLQDPGGSNVPRRLPWKNEFLSTDETDN